LEKKKTNNLSIPFYNNLNGLRFIGALLVFIFHSFTLNREIWGTFFSNEIFLKIFKIASKGHYGVSLFFVLSGFLITSLLINEAKQKEKINPYNFFMRRLLRIWPLYFIIIIFGFFIFPVLPTGFETQNSLLNYSLFISNFEELWIGWQDSLNFLTITWSVSIEEQFYITWVALIILIPAFKKGKNYHFYFIILIIISVIFRLLNYSDERVIYYHTLSVMSDFAIGGLLSYLTINKKWLLALCKISKTKILITYILGGTLIIFSKNIFENHLICIKQLFIGLYFGFIIFEQIYCENSFYKADNIYGFFKLGNISYGIYMYHCIIIYFVQQIIINYNIQNSIFGFLLFILLSGYITIIISRLSYRYIEKPILDLKKNFR
tara:strand:- start:23058 stop:24191 length:1134 start_codon:yes stop_codon:yes gene_type:complete